MTPKQADRRFAELSKAWSKTYPNLPITINVPEGPYCYTRDKSGNLTICPFHTFDSTRPDQLNGYCSLEKRGDWMEGITFLFDHVKLCEINEGEEP